MSAADHLKNGFRRDLDGLFSMYDSFVDKLESGEKEYFYVICVVFDPDGAVSKRDIGRVNESPSGMALSSVRWSQYDSDDDLYELSRKYSINSSVKCIQFQVTEFHYEIIDIK